MTKLELANKLLRKTGTTGTYTTTIGQSGEFGDLVDLLDQAYELIQNKFQSWLFLREDFSFNTVDGTSEYAATDVASDFARWYPGEDDVRSYLTATGTTDEHKMEYLDWEIFKATFLFGAARDTEGRPQFWTIKPDKSLVLYPTPDDIYTVIGEYYKVPDTMDLDADEPIFPERFHWMIIWKALAFFGADSDEPNKEITGNRYYNEFMSRLMADQLPNLNTGGPLA